MQLPINYNQSHWTVRKQARLQYIQQQSGLCHFCREPLDSNAVDWILNAPINWSLFPPNFTRYPVHLHHSHTTGLTIGAVHSICNAYLWQYHGE